MFRKPYLSYFGFTYKKTQNLQTLEKESQIKVQAYIYYLIRESNKSKKKTQGLTRFSSFNKRGGASKRSLLPRPFVSVKTQRLRGDEQEKKT